jgi:ABC-type dipeptide/oligopeptide/nickel transport system ATPase component
MESNTDDLLTVDALRAEFTGSRATVAVRDASLHIAAGEVLGLVGESGSGKSVLVKSLIRILPPNGRITRGRILWRGEELRTASEARMRDIRRTQVSMIFQNPQACLNPSRRIESHLTGVIRQRSGGSAANARRQSLELLERVRIVDPERVLRLYPFECSGGMCQRILIAMALVGRPKLLIADEPTTSLDVTIQAQIIRLLMELKTEFGMSILFVSHDLGVVGTICDRVAVMFRGQIVETAPTAALFRAPGHEYTKELLESSALFHGGRVDFERANERQFDQ